MSDSDGGDRPVEDADQREKRLARQLRLFQTLSILLTALLAVGAAVYVYKQTQILPVKIVVDGRDAANTVDYRTASDALARIRSQAAAGFPAGADPEFVEKVQIVRYPPNWRNLQISFSDNAIQSLAPILHVTVNAATIVVDKVPVVGLPTQAQAQDALDLLRKHYEDMPPNDAMEGDPKFLEDVRIAMHRIPARLARATAAQALEVLITAPPGKTYVVKSGDTGWKIARRFHMRFDKFIASNANINIDKLSIGDRVNVSISTPPIAVEVRKRSQRQEAIRKGAGADSAGERSLTAVTTYVNGVVRGEPETLNVTTVKRAKALRSVM